MLTIYQLLYAGVNLDPDDFVARNSMSTTRGHETWKLAKPQAASRGRRNSLCVCAINDWNTLSRHVVLVETLTQFKS